MSVATGSAAASGATPNRAQGSQEDDPRAALLNTQFKKVRYRADALIEVLHAVQDIYGYLSPEVLQTVARELELPPSRVLGVATFYHLFSFEARGDHTCTVCTGTACFVKGADALVEAVSEAFEVGQGQTRSDGAISLLEARCIGSCGLAPVALVDGGVVAKAKPETLVEVLRKAGVNGEAKGEGAQGEEAHAADARDGGGAA